VRLFFRKQRPAVNDNRLEPAPVAGPAHSSIVATGTSLAGNLDCDGDILIDGTIRGSVRALKLTVGLEGVIEGDISADEVTVRGSVKGPIHARHIHLEPGAMVEGDITTATIAIDTGARLSGAVWQESQNPQTDRTERYTPISTSSWDAAAEGGARPLLAVRPRILGANR
jgi:cytoskeletal protein CcmA (bactofilin family)